MYIYIYSDDDTYKYIYTVYAYIYIYIHKRIHILHMQQAVNSRHGFEPLHFLQTERSCALLKMTGMCRPEAEYEVRSCP